MNYIAIALKRKLNIQQRQILVEGISKFGFNLFPDINYSIDNEVSLGLNDFCKEFKVEELLFVSKPIKDNIGLISSEMSEDLMNYYFKNTESIFLNFVITYLKSFLPLYLIFTYEWDVDDLIIYKKINIDNIRDYFQENCGGHAWKYNYKSKSYIPDFNTPVVIELVNSDTDKTN